MKKIKNTYSEPLVIAFLARTTGKKVRDRWTAQLSVGQSLEVHDDDISPEVLLLKKKGKVSIEYVVESQPDHISRSVKERLVKAGWTLNTEIEENGRVEDNKSLEEEATE